MEMVRFRCLAFHCAQSKRRVSEGILAIICFRLALLGQDRSFIEHSPVGAVCFVPFRTERRLEDHELVLDVRANWPEGSDNKLVFKNASTKYALWERPQLPHAVLDAICDDNEVPVIEGILSEKPPSKKSWRKRYYQLEHLGILANCSSNEKMLTKKESMEMVAMFTDHDIYTPFGNDKLNVGPSQFVIALKPHKTDDRNDVKMLSASNAEEFVHWIAAMRLMKYGAQLRTNYQAVRNQFIAMAKMKKQLSRQGLYGVKPARH
eukprot:scpid75591/ scgid3896/ Growth factor receptor-bound protein 14; GRB14 adapter protein